MEAVRGSGVEVYLDGGVRLGTDVLKALALGARAVFVGRPVLWGLAYQVERNSLEISEIIGWKFFMFRDLPMRISSGQAVSNTFVKFCFNCS